VIGLAREPVPLRAGDALVFPDFALSHRRDPRRRWLVELVGFWTPGYLERKLRRLAEARIERLILCVDEALACAEDVQARLPDARIVWFRRRIDVARVLQIVEGRAASAGS
jgi:hypothetical protein